MAAQYGLPGLPGNWPHPGRLQRMKRFARSASVGGRKGQLLRCGLVRVSYKAAGGLEGAQPASDGAFRVPAGGRSLLHPARSGRGVLVMAVRDISSSPRAPGVGNVVQCRGTWCLRPSSSQATQSRPRVNVLVPAEYRRANTFLAAAVKSLQPALTWTVPRANADNPRANADNPRTNAHDPSH